MTRSVCTILFFVILLTNSFFSQADPYASEKPRSITLTLDSLNFFYYRSVKIADSEADDHIERLQKHIQKFKRKLDRQGSTEYLLSTIFFKTHDRFLKQYKDVVSYDELIAEGTYNCISGTALYVTILSSLDIPYSIYETEDHVFLMVEVDDKRYLMESTDPLNGFISDEKVIASHMAGFTDDFSSQDLLQVGSGDTGYNRFGLKRIHGLAALASLQYYNEAVLLFNEGKLSEAYRLALLGHGLYPSDRLVRCMNTVLDAIVENKDISEGTKSRFQKQHVSYLYK